MSRISRASIGLATCALLANACRPEPAFEDVTLDLAAREYVGLLVALGERDADSLDFYAGPPDWVADIRRAPPSLPQIRASALALSGRLERAGSAGADRARVVHLGRNLRALAGRIDVLTGVGLLFDDESRTLFGVALPPGDEPPVPTAPILARIARLLPGPGSLADRYARLEAAFTVPADRLPAVMGHAITACRARTAAYLTLPADEGVSVEYVANRPWVGFSRYDGRFRSRIQINADLALTVDRALQLACHEGYPGHHVRNTLLEERFVRQMGRDEFLGQARFSPDALIAEGSAAIAVDLAFPGDDRVSIERDELCPLASTCGRDVATYVEVQRLVDRLAMNVAHVARAYVDGRIEFVRAGDALARDALMAHSDATLKYVGEFRSAVLTYTLGRALAQAFVEAHARPVGTAAGRWRAFEQLAIGDPDAVLRDLATPATR